MLRYHGLWVQRPHVLNSVIKSRSGCLKRSKYLVVTIFGHVDPLSFFKVPAGVPLYLLTFNTSRITSGVCPVSFLEHGRWIMFLAHVSPLWRPMVAKVTTTLLEMCPIQTPLMHLWFICSVGAWVIRTLSQGLILYALFSCPPSWTSYPQPVATTWMLRGESIGE